MPDVIHTLSLVLFIYPIIYNLVSAHCLHKHAHCQCHLHVVCTCTHHLLVIPNTPHIPYYPQLSFCTSSPHTSIVCVISILSTNAYVMYISFLLLLFTYVHVIRILSENIHIMCTLCAVVLDMFLPNTHCC